MTAQYEVIDGLPTGLTLSAKMFNTDTPDTEVTGNTFGIVEGTNAKGRYVITITRGSVLAAGDYTTRLLLGSVPIAVLDRRFAGNDGETGQPLPIAAELDSASIDAIWNEVLTGATHNIPSSAGRRLRQLADTVVLVDGVCDAASNAGTDSTGTITLEVGTTTACVGQAIRCENQVRFIASYNTETRAAQLDRPWCVVPDAGDEYVIFNVRNPLVGLASLALSGSHAAVVNEILVDTGTTLPAQIAGIEGGGNGSSVNVLPAVGIVANRSPGVTLLPVVGETISQSITLYQTDGTTPVDLGGKTLKIIFETLSGADVAVVLNNDITVSGADDNVVTFAYPSAVTVSERVLKFALRDAAAPLTMYLQGVCSVVAAPKVDA